ncbi:TlpA disulfide reductase family protein [Pedobacter sp. Hv1]|uniref:TlpA disulfide reductase family protein n=1 Tax=Pedobacter sp. Hv1 TaxID=1740090 RepID=UPI0006D8BC60|nr:TlpA disulfide reductase family protein [Pedobacter sp. Hv1]KQB99998.1 hypothetical protein AQF98_15955 [Pedobacter sp. Hv1]
MKILIKLSVVFVLGLSILQAKAQTAVTLKGKVIGRASKTIIIIPGTTSLRAEDKPTIPIVNNAFEYTFTAKEVAAYQLVFEDEYEKGAWRPVIVFPDQQVIELTLNTMEKHDQNVIKGGSINKAYYAFMHLSENRYQTITQTLSKERERLYEAKNYYSQAFENVMAEVRKTKDGIEAQPFYQKLDELRKTGNDLSPAGQQLKLRFDSLSNARYKWQYAFFNQNINISNYYLMFQDMQYNAKENRYLTMLVNETYKNYAIKFPNHLYTKIVGDAIAGIIKIFPGNQFVDFTAADLKGKQVTLSQAIKGKVALINLWGSWCGPCIAKAQHIVPIYKKYKDKGFTVIGIAREFKNTNALLSRLKKEQFTWLNLVEMDDKNGIWNKYSISNGAGIQVLVDTKGTILAVDPTAEEVDQIVGTLVKR